MLDAAAAFDTVWHDGLFFKIHNSGINGRLWRVLRSAYKHVKSAVFFDGYLSTCFNVHQSVRQGGLGWLSIDAVVGRTAGLKNGVRFPRTIL